MIADLVKAISPNFPTDRQVIGTMDFSRYFKIDYNKRCLYVPVEKALRANLRLIDPFTDAVGAFEKADLSTPPNWSNTTYNTDEGSEAKALSLLDGLIQKATLKVTADGINYIACDIETRRVEFKDNKVIAIGFCGSWDHADIVTVYTKPVVAKLQQLYNIPNNQCRFIWHNGKFDTGRLLYLLNIDARVDEDTMLMHYVGINERKGTQGLKDLGALYLQAPAWDDATDKIKKAFCKANNLKLDQFTYDMFEPKVLHLYLHFDAIATYRLYFTFKPLMRENSWFIYGKLIEASNVYKLLETRGVKLDINYLENLEFQLEQQIVEAQKEVNTATAAYWNPIKYAAETQAKATIKTVFNMNSPKQLKWLLETITHEHLSSTNAATLDELFQRVGDQYPAIQALMKLRKLNKYMDTYVAGFRDLVAEDGRIHGTYNLHGTETGRLSSSDPNMQNIPRDKTIKNLLIAEDGYKLINIDYSQAELRVLAYLSNDDFLTEVYCEGKDMHDSMALKMFGPNFNKEQRVKAKTINFGIPYGRGASSIAQVFKLPMSEAQALIDNWFEQAPGVGKWIKDQRNLIYKNITPVTPLGRERHFVVTYEALNHIQNEYVNFPIQSIASDMTMFSLLEINKWIKEAGLDQDVFIVMSVHDSIVIECVDDKDIIDKVITKALAIESAIPEQYLPHNRVPFKADAETGYAYGTMDEWEAPA